MAPPSFILITLLSLAMGASITEARMVPSHYNNWQGVARDETTVESLEHLIHGESTSLSFKKSDCHTSSDNQSEKAFVREFEPRPSVSAYPDDGKIKGETAPMKDFGPGTTYVTVYPADDAGLEKEKEFVKDFEPRPNISVFQG